MSQEIADIDSRVLHAVSQGRRSLVSIVAATTLLERIVDRSLQRLRKAGKIQYGGPFTKGWRVTP